MEKKLILKSDVLNTFEKLGLKSGQVIMVHTSLSSIGIMMPSQSWKNLDPESGVHWEVDVDCWQTIRDNWPPYDKDVTPTNTMGAVAEMFRLWNGTIRSDHPARSVAAFGKYAKYLTQGHDLSNIFGDGSPVGKLYELDAYVLLIGVGYDKNTSLHLADARAEYEGKHLCTEHSAVTENGKRVWKAYDTLFVDGEDFQQIGSAFEEKHDVKKAVLGNASLRMMKQKYPRKRAPLLLWGFHLYDGGQILSLSPLFQVPPDSQSFPACSHPLRSLPWKDP